MTSKIKTYTGKPCKKGHTLRYKISKDCVVCNKAYFKDYYKTHKVSCKLATRKWQAKTREHQLWMRAKKRATRYGIKFTIKEEDIKIPKVCPGLGTKFKLRDRKTSASLDRVNPKKGYVKNNIAVISTRANTIKADASVKELERVVKWYKQYIQEQQ